MAPEQAVLDELGIVGHETRRLESAWSPTDWATVITFEQCDGKRVGYTSQRDEDGAWAELIDALRRSAAFHQRMHALLGTGGTS